MELFEKQKHSIANANARLNIWDGSVRAGKTVASIIAWIMVIVGDLLPPGRLLMVGRTYGTLYRNIIEPMIDLVGEGQIQIKNEQGSMVMLFAGRRIYLLGAHDKRSEGKIRGSTLAGAYGDEITIWDFDFFKMMLSRLSVEGAMFFGSTNPDNPYHKLKIEYIDRREELDLNYFHFTIDDNIFLPKSYIEAIKKEYQGLWFKRFILGQWVIAEGLIYDCFDDKKVVRKKVPVANIWAVGVDYGTFNPCCFGLFGIKFNPEPGEPSIWLEKSYHYDGREKQKQKSDVQYSADLRDFIKGYSPQYIFIDPSASSFITQLKNDRVRNIKKADNAVAEGIRKVYSMIASGEFVINEAGKGDDKNKGVEEVVKEFYSYVWDEKASANGEDVPSKTNDHHMDLVRYVLYNLYSKNSILTYRKMLTR